MKKITLIIFVCFLFLRVSNAQELFVTATESNTTYKSVAEDSVELKYCTDKMDTCIGNKDPGEYLYSAAIKFPAATISQYYGYKLLKIKVGISSKTPESAKTKVWLASSLIEDRLVEQDFPLTIGEWNEVTLTTPYIIGTGDLFIGYDISMTEGGFPIAKSDNTQDATNGGHLAINSKWTTLAGIKMTGNLCIIGIIEGEFTEYIDLGLTSIDVKEEYIKVNTEVAIGGVVTNNGNVPITSYDVNCTVEGGTPIAFKATGVNIAPGKTVDVRFAKPLSSAIAGFKNVEMNITAINGANKDGNIDNNKLVKRQLFYDKSYQRKVLMEQFSTEPCIFCPQGTTTLKGVVDHNPGVVWVTHHTGYKSDSFTIDANTDLLPLYGENTFAPAVMLERTGNPPIQDIKSVTKDKIKEELEVPAFISVNIFGKLDVHTRNLSVTVNMDVIEVLGNELSLTVYLVEDSIKKTGQAGVTGKYTHNNVCRAALAGSWGESIEFEKGKSYSKTYTTTLDEVWDPSNIRVVAFVNNYNSTDITDCKVYNAEHVNLLKLKPLVSVEDINELEVRVYPNPVKDIINIDGEYDVLYIMDMTGKVVKTIYNQSSIDVKELNRGIYILNVVGGNATKIQKMVLTK